ncbi:hypothetical protein ACP70R_033869 [Stipagrostis hirtigluma subsp. patula]
MGADAKQLPRIDFSGVDPSAPEPGRRCADRRCTRSRPSAASTRATPELRAALFDGAVRPLFALPADAKRRNYYGDGEPFRGYLGSLREHRHRRRPQDRERPRIRRPHVARRPVSEAVHGAARRISELEETVQRMVLEGLGVAKYCDASTRHLFRIEVDGLKPEAWRCRPGTASESPSSRRRRRSLSSPATHSGYSAILFSVPNFKIQAPDELVDDDEQPSLFQAL